jgi:hypothetical protein
MKKEKDLVTKSLDDPRVRYELEHEWFVDEIIVQIEQKMKELGVSRTELASRLKCSPANVTQLLGSSNLTLRTVMDLALALEHRFVAPELVPLSTTAPPWETCIVQPIIAQSVSWEDRAASAPMIWVVPQIIEAEAVPAPYAEQNSGEIHAN